MLFNLLLRQHSVGFNRSQAATKFFQHVQMVLNACERAVVGQLREYGSREYAGGKTRRDERVVQTRSLQAQDRREQEKYPGSKIPERHEHRHAVQLGEALAFGRIRGCVIKTADDQAQFVHFRREIEVMPDPARRHKKNHHRFGQRGRGQKTIRVAHGTEGNERQYKEYLQNVKSFQKAEDQTAGAAA